MACFTGYEASVMAAMVQGAALAPSQLKLSERRVGRNVSKPWFHRNLPSLSLVSAAIGHRWLSARRKSQREPSTCKRGTATPVLDHVDDREAELSKQVEKLREELTLTKTERDDAISDCRNMELSWNDLTATISNLKSESEAVHKCATELDSMLEEKDKMLREKGELAAKLQAEVERLKSETGRQEEESSSLSTLKEELTQKDKLAHKLQAEVKRLKAEQGHEEESSLSALKEEVEARIAAEKGAEEARAARMDLAARNVDLAAESQRLKEETKSLQSRVEVEEELKKQIESLTFKCHSLEDALASWQNLDRDFEEIADRNEAAEAKIREVQKAATEATNANQDILEDISRLEEEKKNLQEALRSMTESQGSLEEQLAKKEEAEAEGAKSLKKLLAQKGEAEARAAELKKEFTETAAAHGEETAKLKEEISKLRATVSEDSARVEERLIAVKEAASEALAAKTEIAANYQTEIDRLKAKNHDLEEALADLKSSSNSLVKAQAEKDKEAAAEIAKAKLAAKEALAAKEEMGSKSQKEIDRLTREQNNLKENITMLNSSNIELLQISEEKDMEMEAAQKAAQEVLADREEAASKLQLAIDKLKNDNNSLQDAFKTLQSSKDNLESSLVEKDQALEVAQKRATEALAAKEESAKSLQLEVDRLKNEKNQLEEAVQSLKSSNADLEKLQAEKDVAVHAARKAAQEEAEANKKLAATSQMETDKLKNQIKSLNNAVDTLKASNENLEQTQRKLDRAFAAKLAEVQALDGEKIAEKEEIISKSKAEVDKLKTEKKGLQENFASWKAEAEKFQQLQAAKDEANEGKISKAEKEAAQAEAAKQEMAARAEKAQQDVRILQMESGSLEKAVQSWKASKESLERKHAQEMQAAEVRMAEAKQAVQEADRAKEEILTKVQPEIARLKEQNQSLEKAVISWKKSKDRLEKVQAEKDRLSEAKLAAAQRAKEEAIAAKEEFAALSQKQIKRLRAENLVLADSANAWKESMDKLKAESSSLATNLEAAVPQRPLESDLC
mmetsp:Transcript_105652/g.187873  ORF Transcript_105652/g.187873 Transcript_105652/m.187873 type:complete len:1025 (-) Transcript_105652:15-3089(-)